MILWPLTIGFDAQGTSGGPQSNRVSFVPTVGDPIERRRSTARVEKWSIKTVPYTARDLARFDAWYDGDAAGGAVPFIWVHPVTRAFGLWRILDGSPPYLINPISYDLYALTFSALRLPGLVDQMAYGYTSGGLIEAR